MHKIGVFFHWDNLTNSYVKEKFSGKQFHTKLNFRHITYFINFLRPLLSSSVCYFTFQVRFNPQFKQLFTRTKFRFSVWACCGHEIGARSQLLLSVFTANVNTIFENFHHSDSARVSAATQLWLHDTAESGQTWLFLHKTQF